MSPRPSIFISAVSKELRNARQLVANTLTFLGYEPEWQDIFSMEEGDLRGMLRRRIDACKGVVQLVGQCYGAEPPTVDEQFGRVSYTQYEALYARQQKKKVWYLILNDDFTTDPHEPEPQELHELQIAYRKRLKSENLIRHSLSSSEALEANVLKLRDELTRLRRGVKHWAIGVAALLVVSVGLSLWLVQHQRSISSSMDMTVALSLLDRAMQARDGSDQGQVKAIESLLALGHSYESTDLSGISLRKAHIAKGDFKEAKLHFTNLSGVQAQGANFSGAGLRFARLDEGNFEQAILSKSYSPLIWGEKVNFNKADLSGANFFAADFRGASFRGANLKDASFAFADLRGASFDGADLTGAYFTGAVLDDATFLGAIISETDFYAAAADRIRLTPEQQHGVCRHGSVLKWYVHVFEEWPSNKYSTGFQYETIIDSQCIWNFDDTSLPLRPIPSGRKVVGFDPQFPCELQMLLERAYLAKADRFGIAHDRVEDHQRLLGQSLSKDRVLKVDVK